MKNKKEIEETLARKIGLMIKEARIIKGMTQDELAKKIGTKQPSIARVERGDRLPSLSFLADIAEALNTDLIPPYFGFMVKDSVFHGNLVQSLLKSEKDKWKARVLEIIGEDEETSTVLYGASQAFIHRNQLRQQLREKVRSL